MDRYLSSICQDVIADCLTDNKIIRYLDDILNENADDRKIDKIIDLYSGYHSLDSFNKHSDFLEAVSEYFQAKVDHKFCIRYLISNELKKMISTKEYYIGFKNIEEILKKYNHYIDLSNDINKKYIYGDTYGESISKNLAELMHDFDITESVIFSKEFSEEIAVKLINETYKKSDIDNLVKKTIEDLNTSD